MSNYFETLEKTATKLGLSTPPATLCLICASPKSHTHALPVETLAEVCQLANAMYRLGEPVMTDHNYDTYCVGELVKRNPNHPFLKSVEPELVASKTVPLPERMLSTQKAYTFKEIEKWLLNVSAAADFIGLKREDIRVRATPKLDGFAAYRKGDQLLTRGDGYSGTDISHALARGIGRTFSANGPGEIVVSKSVFDNFLTQQYENPRNVVAAAIKPGDPDEVMNIAMGDGGIMFMPFSCLDSVYLKVSQITEDKVDELWKWAAQCTPFDTDGLVLEVRSTTIRDYMGSTNHHHRWQIAFKKNEEFHDVRVLAVIAQTGKTGAITPVAEIVPTRISGVTVTRATAHHYGNVIEKGIGAGALIKVCRSGLVIPKIEEVLEASMEVDVPKNCPSCGAETELNGVHLSCTNTVSCPAQIEGRIEFFFKTIGVCDGFGPAAIEQIAKRFPTGPGRVILDIAMVYSFGRNRFDEIFGGKQAVNLYSELQASRQRPIEDWRFLAAFSLNGFGTGMCERLLKVIPLEDVFNTTPFAFTQVEGIGGKTAKQLTKSLAAVKPQFDALMALGFNLTRTPIGAKEVTSPIAGKTLVFTGTMERGKRGDMEKQAKALGAKVGSSVTSKTDYLICGANVGANKTADAEKHGVKVLTESQYLYMVSEDV